MFLAETEDLPELPSVCEVASIGHGQPHISLGYGVFFRAGDESSSEDTATVRLRGGSDHSQTGAFGWLRKGQQTDLRYSRSKGKQDTAVTYKGRKIGSPRPISFLNVLPPASRFARQLKDPTALDDISESSLNNTDNYNISNCQLPSSHRHVRYTLERSQSPHPPSLLNTPAVTTTQPRPVTTNPFAGIYGNPDIVRESPVHPPINYAVSGDLIDKPSALEGLQTGYEQAPPLPTRSSLRDPDGVRAGIEILNESNTRPDAQRGLVVPPSVNLDTLLPKEGEHVPALNNVMADDTEAGDDFFDTEKILASLRPERLSLYNIDTLGRSMNDLNSSDYGLSTPRSVRIDTPGTALRTETDSIVTNDGHNIRTREWDLHSCATDDLDVDHRLHLQEQFAQRMKRRPVFQGPQRQNNVRDNNEPLNGLPEEEASNSQSVFYVELIDIVKFYHERRRVILRAFEAGIVSEEYYKREVWMYGTAMDQTVRAAASMSGYEVLTDEYDIREAIKHPTGYAIYCALLEARNPEMWQRVFKPGSVRRAFPQPTTAPKKQVAMQVDSSIWLARKIGRALRFILVVPDDPDLKTYSSRHPSLASPATLEPRIRVLGPNIPARPQNLGKDTAVEPSPIFPRSNFTSPEGQPKPFPRTSLPATPWNDPTTINNNTAFTGVTFASPLNGRHVRAPRSRGYQQDAFVTVMNPSRVSLGTGSIRSHYGAGKSKDEREEEKREQDRESLVTMWPRVRC